MTKQLPNSQLISKDRCDKNHWVKLDELSSDFDLSTGYWLVPVGAFLTLSEETHFEARRIALWVEGDSDIEALKPAIAVAEVVAIHFPALVDGRGFSLAHLIRDYLEFTGELRAIGHFIQDQLFYLSRCGFDRFEVAEDADVESYQLSLRDFSERYQAAIDEPQPLFRRRA